MRQKVREAREVEGAIGALKAGVREVMIGGGGVQYEKAGEELTRFASSCGSRVIETIAGRANLLADHPLNIGPVGVTGSDSGNWLAERAAVILSVGSRLPDFTTGSWNAFAKDAKFISINTASPDPSHTHTFPPVWTAKVGTRALT